MDDPCRHFGPPPLVPTRAADIRFFLECDDGRGGARYIDDALLVSVGVGGFRFRSSESLAFGVGLTASFQYGRLRLDAEARLSRRPSLRGQNGETVLYEANIDEDCAGGMEELLRRYLGGLCAPRLREVLASVLFSQRMSADGGAEAFSRMLGFFGGIDGIGDKRGFAVGMLEEFLGCVGSEWAALVLDTGATFASLGERPEEGAVHRRVVYNGCGRPVGSLEVAAPPSDPLRLDALDHLALALSGLFGPRYEVPAAVPRAYAMVGESRQMEALRRSLAGFKDSGRPLLLSGEPGTGKGLYARILHSEGSRRGAPFKEVDCAVFGGSWAPLFEGCRGGTLFLRSLDGLDGPLQDALADLLDEAPEDIRFVASIRDPAPEVLRPSIRRRFSGHVVLAPLRHRGGDAVLLAGYFLGRECAKRGIGHRALSPQEIRDVEGNPWPGNIAELKRYVIEVLVSADGGVGGGGSLKERLALFERAMILQQIEISGGNKSEAARSMGLSREALRKKLLRSKKSAA